VFKSVLSLAALLLFLSSCATHQNIIAPIQQDIKQGRCEAALPALEKLTEKSGSDQLLYLMEYGSALQICKQYAKSNEVLLKADQLSEQIDYVSLSRTMGATLLNEQMLQYKGDKFEKLFINAMTALNFIELGQSESAMVEVRRINEKTKKLSAEEAKDFELNSFAQYLAGLVYEIERKYDDACISYKDAYKLDASFRSVALDMLTACWRAKRTQEFNQLVKQIQASDEEISFAKRDYKKTNEKIIIFLQGWGPKKAVRANDAVYPYLQPTFSNTKKLIVSAAEENNSLIKFSEPVYSVEKTAISTLEEDYKTLGARRLGARVAKEIMADQIRQKDKALGDLAWLVMVASERADLRNWSMLPESIQIVRVDATQAKILNLSGRNYGDSESENFGQIDLSLDPQKTIYLIRSVQ
jgi:uncharacterized protein